MGSRRAKASERFQSSLVIVLKSGSPRRVWEGGAADAGGLSGEGILHVSAIGETSAASHVKRNARLPTSYSQLAPSRSGLRGPGRRRRSGHHHLVDPSAVHLRHLEPPALPFEMIADGGNAAELRYHEPPRRPVLGLGLVGKRARKPKDRT